MTVLVADAVGRNKRSALRRFNVGSVTRLSHRNGAMRYAYCALRSCMVGTAALEPRRTSPLRQEIEQRPGTSAALLRRLRRPVRGLGPVDGHRHHIDACHHYEARQRDGGEHEVEAAAAVELGDELDRDA